MQQTSLWTSALDQGQACTPSFPKASLHLLGQSPSQLALLPCACQASSMSMHLCKRKLCAAQDCGHPGLWSPRTVVTRDCSPCRLGGQWPLPPGRTTATKL